jgi:hypothetical protein
MLYSEIIAVSSRIHTKHINILCGKNVECRTYRAVNTLRLCYKTSQLILYSEIIAVCSEIHTKYINTLCGQKVKCRTYRAVNTHCLDYKNQSVNAV